METDLNNNFCVFLIGALGLLGFPRQRFGGLFTSSIERFRDESLTPF